MLHKKDMKAYELISWLEGMFPPEAAEDWDNVGLLVGDDNCEVEHVFLALDLTEPVLEEAAAAGGRNVRKAAPGTTPSCFEKVPHKRRKDTSGYS